MKKALVLSLAAVLCLGFASFAQEGTLTGTWDTYLCYDGATCCFAIDTTIDVTYTICGWAFTSESVFGGTPIGWMTQTFSVDGSLGAFTIGSELVFDPTAATFTSWKVTGGLSLAGVTFDGTFGLNPVDGTSLELVGSGSAGCVDVSVDMLFGALGDGICDFNWNGVTIDISFPFCCIQEVDMEVIFDCTSGFVSACFTVTGIALPGLTWATLDAELCFTPGVEGGKTLVITPNFDFGDTACFHIYLTNPGTLFGDITIDGISIECTIGGVSFTGISYWGACPKPGILKGTPYWEAYQISTDEQGCCGPFTFFLDIYFLGTNGNTVPGGIEGTFLFDVAAISAGFDIALSEQFTMGLTVDSVLQAAPAGPCWAATTVGTSFCLHFLVEW